MKTRKLLQIGSLALLVAAALVLPACGDDSNKLTPLATEAGADAAADGAPDGAADAGAVADAKAD